MDEIIAAMSDVNERRRVRILTLDHVRSVIQEAADLGLSYKIAGFSSSRGAKTSAVAALRRDDVLFLKFFSLPGDPALCTLCRYSLELAAKSDPQKLKSEGWIQIPLHETLRMLNNSGNSRT